MVREAARQGRGWVLLQGELFGGEEVKVTFKVYVKVEIHLLPVMHIQPNYNENS